MDEKRYWKGYGELNQDSDFIELQQKEFAEELPLEEIFGQELVNKSSGRRDFLKIMGFSVSAATLAAGCEIPVRKAIPYVLKPEEITPGVPNYYASTYMYGGDYASIVVKTQEGRPIKIEGNTLSKVSAGATSAKVQASVLSLYDTGRLKGPRAGGKDSNWADADKDIIKQLQGIRESDGQIRILTSTILSPSTRKIIAEFITAYPSTQHVQYDPMSASGMLYANQASFGIKAIPSYRFDKAEVIVSFAADFLGTWISPVEYTRQYASTRKVKAENASMSRHYQFEAGMSLSGTNADRRAPLKPSREGLAIMNLYNLIASSAGVSPIEGVNKFDLAGNVLKENVAKDLWKARGKALVIAGSNDPLVQEVVNGINVMLESYGNTIDIVHTSNQRQGDDKAMMGLVKDMNAGNISAIIIYGVNPAYDFPMAAKIKSGLSKVKLSISLSGKADETASLCSYIVPDHHYLEAWNDAEPQAGVYSLCQPTISPLFDTRDAAQSLLTWIGDDRKYYHYIKDHWRESMYPLQNKYSSFDNFWDHTLHNGVWESTQEETATPEFQSDLTAAAANITSGGEGLEVQIYEKIGIGDGTHTDNPWLQELPDPVTKVVWDNYAAVSQKLAKEKELSHGSLVKITSPTNRKGVVLPVLIQPGQAHNTISIAVGYGRTAAGPAAMGEDGKGIGQNAYTFVTMRNGTCSYFNEGVNLVPTGEKYQLVTTQEHHNLNPVERPIIKETNLPEYKKDPLAGNHDRVELKKHLLTLYNEYEYHGHHWAMAIDLNACTGCGNCIIACQAENNTPTIGKKEVGMKREMHWLRIDRYYMTYKNTTDHEPEEFPEVVHQPMLCMHCDHAPCETVCPVAATNHSSEGLNQMAYNRCVGTRYCANNCPYKVRRFNYLDYTGADSFAYNEHVVEGSMDNDLSRMVLNPDVSVRSRGVMEKCTFCVQRIQTSKLKAKKEGRPLQDGDIKTACQQTCPANAIVFGDLNDENSEVSKLFRNERLYHALEELHTLPSLGYLTKVRNKPEEAKT